MDHVQEPGCYFWEYLVYFHILIHFLRKDACINMMFPMRFMSSRAKHGKVMRQWIFTVDHGYPIQLFN